VSTNRNIHCDDLAGMNVQGQRMTYSYVSIVCRTKWIQYLEKVPFVSLFKTSVDSCFGVISSIFISSWLYIELLL
jgi:hypothetical protein